MFRVFILNSNEEVDREISKDVLSGSISMSYTSGQRRSVSLSLGNFESQWQYGADKNLWCDTKFRVDVGVVVDDILYWQPLGVFLLKDLTPSLASTSNVIALTLCDKWGIWNGDVFGKTQLKTIIPAQVSIKQVFDNIVHEINNIGEMWDKQPIKFNSKHVDTLSYYTIRQDAGQAKSDNLIDLATTISSDIYYDNLGCMNVENNIIEFMNNNFPIIWNFEEGDANSISLSVNYNRSKYFNQITTNGAIVNGYQFSATVTNKNRKSLYNVYDTPITPKINDNSKLYSDNLCLEQSMYEMISQSRGLLSLNLQSTFLPFLDVNSAVKLNFSSLGIRDMVCIIDSISYNFSSDCNMTIGLTSNIEVVF